MPRWAFRQIDYRDIDMFFRDGELRSKNHPNPQACHQTSYTHLVQLRGTGAFQLPHGGVVNDYVAFYFSPFTAFTCTIHRGNVNVTSPTGEDLGPSRTQDRAFLVAKVDDVYAAGLPACFSNYALNSQAPQPVIKSNYADLATHVNWQLFDEVPLAASIAQIGYNGVCRFFNDRTEAKYQTRSKARMAEFLVLNSLPVSLISCVVTPNELVQNHVMGAALRHGYGGLVLQNPGCFV